MDTPRLDNILRTLSRTDTRQTENADARLEIKREEKEDERKQREKKQRDDEEAADADLPRISVPALKLFLANLLREAAPPVAQQQRPSTPAGNAAQAYGRNTAPPPPSPPQQPAAGAPALSVGEVEVIRKLQVDLAALDEIRTPELILRPGENFLASLVTAVQAAKN